MEPTYKLDTKDNTKIILTKPVYEVFTIAQIQKEIQKNLDFIAARQARNIVLQAKIDNATVALNLK